MARWSFPLFVAALVASPAAFAAPKAPPAGQHAPPSRRKPPAGKSHGAGRSAHTTAARDKSAHGTSATRSKRPSSIDGSTAPRTVADPADPHEQRIATLRAELESLLHEKPLSKTRVGVEVVTASSGDVLFDHNGGRLFNPASNTKMLTTAAAMSQLGPDFRYHTQLLGPTPDADGVVHGDVDLRGAGDPSLKTEDLAEVARNVAARGVTKIDGAIVTDGRFRDSKEPDRSVGDQAIILNRNTYAIHIDPTEPKHKAAVDIEPETDYVTVRNEVVTVHGKKTRIKADVGRDGARLVVILKGRVSDQAGTTIKKRVGDSSLFAAAIVRRALQDFGVEVTGGVKPGSLPSSTPLLAEHLSRPLSEICRVSNKDSNNFVAEAIFKTVGGQRFGMPGTLAKGQQAVHDLMQPLGFEKRDYTILNGSGLTHENRIAPSSLTRLLRHLFFDLSVSPEFLSSLAVGGIDGTIRGRFRGTDAVGLVRAKTGTLDSVSALSGYVGQSGDVIVFSILVEGFRHKKLGSIRAAQVRMVDAMLHYLRADEPKASPLSAPPVMETPADDSEDDGDPSIDVNMGGGGATGGQ